MSWQNKADYKWHKTFWVKFFSRSSEFVLAGKDDLPQENKCLQGLNF